ncbi:hypothetical protein Bhyg_01086 [Pseudolycoriella hygida]|uniref:Uncharacterized protein n=1 Tax=Pseudolycoriella hygida TaxID=35572 RepID=A0A9Q0S569_9DIPT|nr:hypothetical protein Bhyg_01086 [Pseudolycoriella hygida]
MEEIEELEKKKLTALDCPNPFKIPSHNENNHYPLKRVSPLIQAHALGLGCNLEIGIRICDKCRLYARNTYIRLYKNKKPRNLSARSFATTTTTEAEAPKPTSPIIKEEDIDVDDYVEGTDESYNFTIMEDGEQASSSFCNSDSVSSVAVSEFPKFKIVNVTSLPAEKHNEIINNDDNASDSLYNHQLKISEIISSTPNSNLFGIARKISECNDMATPSTSKAFYNAPNKSNKKKSKLQKIKQRMQQNYRAQFQNVEEVASSPDLRKEANDSDSNSKLISILKVNRRKNTLTPLDCEIEFVESNPPIQRQSLMTMEDRILSQHLEIVKRIRNPNSELIRKVAFLRVCVNYMMTELVGETFNFGKNITFENLKVRYYGKRNAAVR